MTPEANLRTVLSFFCCYFDPCEADLVGKVPGNDVGQARIPNPLKPHFDVRGERLNALHCAAPSLSLRAAGQHDGDQQRRQLPGAGDGEAGRRRHIADEPVVQRECEERLLRAALAAVPGGAAGHRRVRVRGLRVRRQERGSGRRHPVGAGSWTGAGSAHSDLWANQVAATDSSKCLIACVFFALTLSL